MNKKQIMKEQKRLKQERKQVETLFQDDKEVYNVFKILLGVLLFIGLVYAVINITNGNWNIFTKKNTEVEAIDSRMVIVGNMFNKSSSEYMVLAYDMQNSKYDYFGTLISDYYGTKKLYLVDLSSGFNTSFIGEKNNITSDLNKLTFAGCALLIIKDDKIVTYYTNEKAITDYIMNEK